MQLSMKCSVAVHCLIFISEFGSSSCVTSALLAKSTGCNPVIIRTVMSTLKKAGLITSPRGTGGAELRMQPENITLAMIYRAVEPEGLSPLIGIHPCAGRPCPVAQNIGGVLQKPYQQIETSIWQTMDTISLASLLDDFHTRLAQQAAAGKNTETKTEVPK